MRRQRVSSSLDSVLAGDPVAVTVELVAVPGFTAKNRRDACRDLLTAWPVPNMINVCDRFRLFHTLRWPRTFDHHGPASVSVTGPGTTNPPIHDGDA